MTNFQLPAEEGNRTIVLESIVIRRTWCIRGRVLWLEEIFCSRKELIEISIRAGAGLQPGPLEEPSFVEWNLLNNYTKQYLTRRISAGKKFDIITFFYGKIPPENVFKDEEAVLRRAHSNRSLPPTLDVLIPRYCVVFVDAIGKRRSIQRKPRMAVLTAGRHYQCSLLSCQSRP